MRSTACKLKQFSVYLDEDLAQFLIQTAYELKQTESEYIRNLIKHARSQYRKTLIKQSERT